MFRIFKYYTNATMIVCGSVMTTQGIYDAENASMSFRALGFLLLMFGVFGGARVVKNDD